jgi:hypothetical protein
LLLSKWVHLFRYTAAAATFDAVPRCAPTRPGSPAGKEKPAGKGEKPAGKGKKAAHPSEVSGRPSEASGRPPEASGGGDVGGTTTTGVTGEDGMSGGGGSDAKSKEAAQEDFDALSPEQQSEFERSAGLYNC